MVSVAGPSICLYAIEPARESRCSINFPIRMPPHAFTYCSRSSGEDENGRTSCEYESYICREGSSEGLIGDAGGGTGDFWVGDAAWLAVIKLSDQSRGVRIGISLR